MGKKRRKNGLVGKMEKSEGVFDKDVQVGYRNMKEEVLDQNKIDILYNNDLFFKRLIDEVPADSLKNGFTLYLGEGKDDIVKKIIDLYNKLQLDNYLTQFIQMGRKDGFAALLPVMKVAGDMRTDEELDISRILEIRDFNIVKKQDVVSIQRNMDITKKGYGEIEYIILNNRATNTQVKYHRSWFQIFETGLKPSGWVNQNQFDLSLYAGLFQALQVNYNINWSTGQVAFATLLKVLKIANQQYLDELRKNKSDIEKKELELNSSTLAILGKDDEISSLNLSKADFEGLQKVNLNDISTKLGIPVSKLMGSSAGALASAQEDTSRYTEVVEQYQQTVVKDYLRYYVNMFLQLMKISERDFEIIFNSIKAKDSKKIAEEEKLKAETKKAEAEADKIKIEALIALNKELNDESISNVLKQIAQGLKAELLGEIE